MAMGPQDPGTSLWRSGCCAKASPASRRRTSPSCGREPSTISAYFFENQGSLADGEDGIQLLTEAADAFRAALRFRSEVDTPLDWFTSQTKLGWTLCESFERQGEGAPPGLLDEAIAVSAPPSASMPKQSCPSCGQPPSSGWATRSNPKPTTWLPPREPPCWPKPRTPSAPFCLAEEDAADRGQSLSNLGLGASGAG